MMYDWQSGWTNSRHASDLRRHGAYYDVTVMMITVSEFQKDELTKLDAIGEVNFVIFQ